MFSSGIDWQTVGAAVAVFTALATATTWIANRIFKFGQITERLSGVEKDVEKVGKNLDNTRVDLTKRIDDVLTAVVQKQVSDAKSPRQLNDEGKRILEESGIKDVLDDRFDEVVSKVRKQKPQNAYQGEQLVMDAVQGLYGDSSLRNELEQGSFRSGSIVGTVLYVGGIYVRDRVLTELGMNPSDLDSQNSSNLKKNTT